MASTTASLCALLVAAFTSAGQAATLQPSDDPATSAIWLKVRASLFEGRTIAPAPAKYTGDADAFIGVANHQVFAT